MGQYDTAQICLNGHVSNDSVGRSPQFNKKFCEICGEKTIVNCPQCSTPIRGDYISDHMIIGPSNYTPPAYCYNCGNAFPWTEAKIKATMDLVKESKKLNAVEIKEFEESIKDIVRDTPKTQLGASRFKKILNKAGSETSHAIRETIVDIISETAKKIIWPNN